MNKKHTYVFVGENVLYKVNNATHTAWWAPVNAIPEGEHPIEFTQKVANDIAYALALNGYDVCVVTKFLPLLYVNKRKEEQQ